MGLLEMCKPRVSEVWLHIMFYFSKILGEAKLKTCFCRVITHFGSKSMCISRGTNTLDLFLVLVGVPYMNSYVQIRPAEVRRPKFSLMRPEQQQNTETCSSISIYSKIFRKLCRKSKNKQTNIILGAYCASHWVWCSGNFHQEGNKGRWTDNYSTV